MNKPPVTPGLPLYCQSSVKTAVRDPRAMKDRAFITLYSYLVKICVETIAAFLSELQLLMQPEAFPVSVMVWMEDWLLN